MKRTNKKGFTIVELVIVIAVIAILAAVLIPNLSRLVGKANESSAMQAARNEYQAYLAEYAKDLAGDEEFVIVKGKYAFEVTGGKFDEVAKDATSTAYNGISKVDLTKNVVKSAEATEETGTTAPTVSDTVVGGKWYSDVTCKTEVASFTKGTTYYYAVALAEDLGSAEVAIYAK